MSSTENQFCHKSVNVWSFELNLNFLQYGLHTLFLYNELISLKSFHCWTKYLGHNNFLFSKWNKWPKKPQYLFCHKARLYSHIHTCNGWNCNLVRISKLSAIQLQHFFFFPHNTHNYLYICSTRKVCVKHTLCIDEDCSRMIHIEAQIL